MRKTAAVAERRPQRSKRRRSLGARRDPSKGRRYDPALAVLGLLFVGALLLNLWRIDWSVPDAARRALYPPDNNALFADYNTAMDRQFYKTSAIVSFQPDEITVIRAFFTMRPNKLELNPRFFAYPTFSIYAVGAVLEVGKLLRRVTISLDLTYYFDHPNQMGAIYIAGRLVFVLLGALGVVALFWVARRLYDTRTATIAAALLATCPEWLRESHFVAVNIPQATFMTCAVAASLTLRLSPRPMLWTIAAGAATGLAAGSKYPGVLICGVVLLCLFERWRYDARRGGASSTLALLRRSVVLLLTTIAAFLLTTPYALLDTQTFVNDVQREYTLKVVDSATLPLGTPQWVGLLLVSFGVPVLVAAFVGIGMAGRDPTDFRLWLMLVWAAPFLVTLAISHIIYARYIVPLAPLVVLLAALPIAWLLRQVQRPKALYRATAIALLVVFAVPTLFNTFLAERGFSQTPQMDSALWLRANLPRNSRILLFDTPSFDAPPLDNTYYRVQVNGEWQSQDFDAIIFTSVNRWIPDRFRPLRRSMLDSKAGSARFENFEVRQFSSRPPTPGLPDDWIPEDWKYTEYSVFVLYKVK